MKKIIPITFNFLALIITLIWAYKTNWDYEPIVGTLILLASLFGQLIAGTIGLRKNKMAINGGENKVIQDTTRGDKNEDVQSENKILVTGNKNVVIQDMHGENESAN